ncbi:MULTISPECIES: ATP-binding protein [Actinomadura]|uniref:ATP-binding protein n=1 Tax=Actinomadura yumaensis TaxID=111807 RepID=A0ABW2CK31_9ACTN|nr:ATP-binding protein [Actinomadura sp. J1-007]MWK38675.1 ATP-binding protein [Actinomadura sp. J1-007]
MELNLDIRLPRDSVSVPAVRGLLEASLRSLGVLAPIREDIELMLTEACTNVIKHAQDGDDYTVRVTIMNARCILKVIDTGTGFDADEVPEPSPHAEHGRGLMIIQALADDVRFRSFPHNGALVALEKRLRYWEGSLGHRYAHAGPDGPPDASGGTPLDASLDGPLDGSPHGSPDGREPGQRA